MILGPPPLVEHAQWDLELVFMCKQEGALTKYIGNKLNILEIVMGVRHIRVTQPILVQKLVDKYVKTEGPASKTPAFAGQVLVKGDGDGRVNVAQQRWYCSATATCMYLMQL